MRTSLLGFINCLRFYLALLPLAAWGQASAQASERIPPYYLEIGKQAIELPNRTAYVEQVLDGRPGRPSIGLIYRGMAGKQRPVLFRQGLDTELTAWLQQQLPSRPADHAVVLCVRQLRVNEVVNGFNSGSLASADVIVDVYAHLPDGYHFVRNVGDYASHSGLGLNTTPGSSSDHASRVALVLQRSLAQIGDVDWSTVGRRPVQTLAQLVASKSPVAYRPAILRAAIPRRGVYLDLEQFLANRPDTTISLRIDTVSANTLSNVLDSSIPTGKKSDWTGTVLLRAKLRTAGGDKLPPEEVWGFSDGRHAYLRQFNNYRLLTKQDNFFAFVGAAPVDVAATNRQTGRNLSSLSMGTGVYAYGPAGTTGQPMVYALDLRTGQAAPYPTPGQPLRADTAFVYVYRPLGGSGEPQRVLLNDHEVGKLKPGQYLELAWTHIERPMRLSVGTAGGPALLASPSAVAANYIKLTSSSAASPWQWMPVRQGEAEVDALEKPQK